MKPYKRHIIEEERKDYCPYYPYSSDYIELEEYRDKEELISELDGVGLDWYSDEYLPFLKRQEAIDDLLGNADDYDRPFKLLPQSIIDPKAVQKRRFYGYNRSSMTIV